MDALGRGLGAQARRDDIRPAADEIRGQRRWQAEGAREVDARGARSSMPRSGPAPMSAAMPVLLQQDLLFDRQHFGVAAGAARIRLAHAAAGFEAIVEALREQRCRLGAQFLRRFRGVERGVQPRELGVAGSDASRQDQARLVRIRARGHRLRSCRRERRAILAPEVELPGEIQRGPAVVVPTLRRHLARSQVVLAVLLRA